MTSVEAHRQIIIDANNGKRRGVYKCSTEDHARGLAEKLKGNNHVIKYTRNFRTVIVNFKPK